MSRTIQLSVGGAIIAAILVGIFYQGTQSTVFFYTPSEILDTPNEFEGRTIRIGALVAPGSTEWDEEAVQLKFRITEDSRRMIPVVFDGVKPDMYREGQGVVVEGTLDAMGVFRANTLLVKHSEEYKVDPAQAGNKEEMYRSLIQN